MRGEQRNKEQFRGIAEVGSIDFQRRWCIHGTAAEFILLDELIETTISAAKHRATHPVLSKPLSAEDKTILVDFHDRVEELSDQIPWNDSSVSIQEIVENNEAMIRIRDVANDCLLKLGIEYSVKELLAD